MTCQLGIAGPAVFLTMWAIGGNSGKVAEVTVDGTIVKFGSDRMGNGHFAICLKTAGNIKGTDFRDRQFSLKNDFQIPETVINEFRLPDKWVGISVDIGIFLGDIAIVDIAIDIAPVHITIFGEQFTVEHRCFCSGFSGESDAAYSGKILTEIIDETVFCDFVHAFHRNFLYNPALGGSFPDKCTGRRSHDPGIFP